MLFSLEIFDKQQAVKKKFIKEKLNESLVCHNNQISKKNTKKQSDIKKVREERDEVNLKVSIMKEIED